MSVWLCMALVLVGLGYKYAWYVFWFGWIIFIGWWMLFKMKGQAEQMKLYSNLVVTAGLDIDSHMNGYSQRPYSKGSDVIKNKLKREI